MEKSGAVEASLRLLSETQLPLDSLTFHHAFFTDLVGVNSLKYS